jgi:hypothetical protein
LPESTLLKNGPLIIQTLAKPFLPGRQLFALYENHVVIATIRGPLDFPEEVYRLNEHDAWKTLARSRKVTVLSIADIDWMRSYESGVSTDSSVKLTFQRKKAKWSVLLPEKEGTMALTYLAGNFGDKFDATVESTIDVRRKMRWALFLACLLIDGWVAWAMFGLWTTQTISGPTLFVRLIGRIYEARGFATTATITVLCTVFFNILMWVLSLATPPTKRRTMNCGNCGYSLRGSTANRCPKCGTETPASERS